MALSLVLICRAFRCGREEMLLRWCQTGLVMAAWGCLGPPSLMSALTGDKTAARDARQGTERENSEKSRVRRVCVCVSVCYMHCRFSVILCQRLKWCRPGDAAPESEQKPDFLPVQAAPQTSAAPSSNQSFSYS